MILLIEFYSFWRNSSSNHTLIQSNEFISLGKAKKATYDLYWVYCLSACNEGDLGSIPGSGRSSGEGHDNPLEYSCLEKSMARGA